MVEKREPGIAVLIDGENVGASFAGRILGTLQKLGRIDIGNVYFDLKRGQSAGWIRYLPSLPLEPVVTAVEETGRSGSDISLILDAVEILHTRDIGIFCICSSDGDFTGLARYLRAHGKEVIVAGDGKRVPSSLRVSCERFIDIGKPESAMASDLKGPSGAAQDADGKAAEPGLGDEAVREESTGESPETAAPGSTGRETGSGHAGLPVIEIPEGSGDAGGSVQLELSFGAEDESPAVSEHQEEDVILSETDVPAESASCPEPDGTVAPPSETALPEENPDSMTAMAAAALRDIMESTGGRSMNPSALQQRLRRLLPGFSVRKLGFRRFADFLASLEAADGEPQAKDGGLESSSPGDSAEVS